MSRPPALAEPSAPAPAPPPAPAAGRAARAGRALLEAPAALPCLAALAILIWWAAGEGGYPLTVWLPGGLLLVGLLAGAVAGLRGDLALIPRPARVAMVLLAAYTVWSYASIAWADARGDAWDGANRTLVYLVVFVLFAAWHQRGRTAGLLLGGWVLAIAVLAAVTLVRLSGAADPLPFFIGARLAEPAGYPNAAAATWLMAAFPALVLAGRAQVAWWLRGMFAAAVVVLADVALLSQSRGSLFALPVVLIACFVVVPDRARTLGVLAATGAAVAATAPRMLAVADRLTEGAAPTAAAGGIAAPVLIAALGAGVAVAVWAALEKRRPPSPAGAATVRRAVNALGLLAAAAVVAGALVATGNPVTTAGDGWRSFKRTYPPAEAGRSRLTRGLGSNRYDFYRVGVATFRAHPLVGVGADNFAQDYLVRRRSGESPRYPHSLELRALVETGAVGAALLFGALAAALLAAWRAVRRADPLASAAAGGATLAFLYWAVHGSADWLWEFAGLGAPAFAMLGVACAAHPRPEPDAGDAGRLLRGPAACWRAALALALAGLDAAGAVGRGAQRGAGGARLDLGSPAGLRAPGPRRQAEPAVGSPAADRRDDRPAPRAAGTRGRLLRRRPAAQPARRLRRARARRHRVAARRPVGRPAAARPLAGAEPARPAHPVGVAHAAERRPARRRRAEPPDPGGGARGRPLAQHRGPSGALPTMRTPSGMPWSPCLASPSSPWWGASSSAFPPPPSRATGTRAATPRRRSTSCRP